MTLTEDGLDVRSELQADFELNDFQVIQEEYRHLLPYAFGEPNFATADVFWEKWKGLDASEAPTALCLSGGGIRSATFALGVMQGLERCGQLDQFSYLSTVSGGGYIGSWLSRWRAGERGETEWVRPTGELSAVMREAPDRTRPPDHPIRRLRGFSNYLSPNWGFSVDTFVVVTIFLRNLLFNWSMWAPLLLILALLPRVFIVLFGYAKPLLEGLCYEAGNVVWFVGRWFGLDYKPVAPDWARVSLAALTVPTLACMAWALAALVVYINRGMTEEKREVWSRWSARLVFYGLGWFALFLLFVYIPDLLLSFDLSKWAPKSSPQLFNGHEGVISTGLTALITTIVALVGFWGQYGDKIRTNVKSVWAKLGGRALDILALLAIVALATGSAVAAHMLLAWVSGPIADGANSAGHPGFPDGKHFYRLVESSGWRAIAASLVVLVLAFLASFLVGNNRYSLHSLYGNRLVRAYLGSARTKRESSPVTDFDPGDNIAMADLSSEVMREGDEKPTRGLGLFHVVNMTLNLTRPNKATLDWQERKGASFVATKLRCGSPRTGYVAPTRLGGRQGFTLGRAMTISGAAASPNMGYHSSPLVTLLMTLLNIRLGCWVRNPERLTRVQAGGSRWSEARARMAKGVAALETNRSDPPFALWYAAKEAFSGTSDESGWLYLSDGGHFDNLGLYEMVRRRCRRIVVVDAGCDGEFKHADLLTAVRLVQVDLCVPIVLPPILPGQEGKGGQQRVTVGRVCYSALEGGTEKGIEDGQIFIVKPILLGNEPPALRYYRDTSRKGKNAFPHHSTTDQFFNESQFESYRALGEFSAGALAEALAQGWDPPAKADLAYPVEKTATSGKDKEKDSKDDEPKAKPAAPATDLNLVKLLPALLAGMAALGLFSGLGSSIVQRTFTSSENNNNRDGRSLDLEVTTTKNDPEVLALLSRLTDLLELLIKREQPDRELIQKIENLILVLRQRPGGAATPFDDTVLRKISGQLDTLSGNLNTQHNDTINGLKASIEELRQISRSVPVTGPRRNIRGGQ